MELSLLETKLYIPPLRPGLVTRPRLLARLQESLHYNFILVSAPAGFGKTTLVSEWVTHNQSNFQTAWVSLEKGENDPSLFWDYFITAVRKVKPSAGDISLKLLHSDQPVPIQNILATLLNDIASISSHLVLVLDDYHLIESRQIHDGISFFIEHLPPLVHLVIASRADPPLPLARFRGKAMMLELHTDDLRFSIEDTVRLFRELKISDLSEKDIMALNERTEGWAAGLKMAAISMEEQADIPDFIASFTGSQRYVMDYLLEEVLQAQNEEVREFMIKTSVLERLSGPLCNAVVARKNSQQILANLERDYLFIVPLDESRQWYRYEHLFADLLRSECETTYGTEQVTSLHLQASQWYEENKLPDEAINHALKARDWERAIRLISFVYEERRKRLEYDTLLNWLKSFPEEKLRENIQLYFFYAELLVLYSLVNEAEIALNYLESRSPDNTRLQGEIAFAQGMVHRHRGDTVKCIELLEKAFTLLPEEEVGIRSRVAVNLAQSHHRIVSIREAVKWVNIAVDLARQAGDISTVCLALNHAGNIAVYQGKLKRAVEFFVESEKLGSQIAWSINKGTLSMCYYLFNDLEAAAENAGLAIKEGELTAGIVSAGSGGGLSAGVAFRYLAWICLARGDLSGAEAAMEHLDRLVSQRPPDTFWYASYIAGRVTYAISRGNIDEAIRWGEQLPDVHSMIAFDRCVPAQLLLSQGKRTEAARLLKDLYDDFALSGNVICANKVRIYQALAEDDEEQAMEFLAEALVIAEPEGIIRDFVDEGKLLKPLLEKALSRQITPEFTKQLLEIIDREEQQRQALKQVPASSSSPGLLSERELEVIRLLADDVSNQHIAGQLCVNLSTVKTHVHHIIEKLEVKDRRQAVRRAKDLKLI